MHGGGKGFSLQPGGSGEAERRCAVLAGKAAFFAGGEAVGGGGVTVPVEILGKMPKGGENRDGGFVGTLNF